MQGGKELVNYWPLQQITSRSWRWEVDFEFLLHCSTYSCCMSHAHDDKHNCWTTKPCCPLCRMNAMHWNKILESVKLVCNSPLLQGKLCPESFRVSECFSRDVNKLTCMIVVHWFMLFTKHTLFKCVQVRMYVCCGYTIMHLLIGGLVVRTML